MFKALKETIDPKGGHGMTETVIAIILIVVVLALIVFNYMGIVIDPLFEKVVTVVLGYMIGKNNKDPWTGDERRTKEQIEKDEQEVDDE